METRPALTTVESLTLENFWNELYQTCPNQMTRFYNYIDEFKARKNWKTLVQDGIKFHHLPVEFQVGVIMQFVYEVAHHTPFAVSDIADMGHMVTEIRQWFMNEEENIKVLGSPDAEGEADAAD